MSRGLADRLGRDPGAPDEPGNPSRLSAPGGASYTYVMLPAMRNQRKRLSGMREQMWNRRVGPETAPRRGFLADGSPEEES